MKKYKINIFVSLEFINKLERLIKFIEKTIRRRKREKVVISWIRNQKFKRH